MDNNRFKMLFGLVFIKNANVNLPYLAVARCVCTHEK